MKIALVLPNNTSKAPYLKYFENILIVAGADYELIVWDRDGVEEHAIRYRTKPRNGVLGKIRDYMSFARFVRKVVRKKQYDRLIVYTGQMALFLGTFLYTRYRNRYWLDIRDYSAFLKLLPGRFNRVVRSSAHCSISSPAFKTWLPKGKPYIMSHNLDNRLIEQRMEQPDRPSSDFFNAVPLHLDTIGQIKYLEAEKELISAFKNDRGFRLGFFGFGPALPELKEWVDKEKIDNVHFHGAYQKEEENDLLSQTNLLNILIPREDINGKTLLSNRIYLSALLQIPGIVYEDTAQSEILKKYKLGFSVTSYEKLRKKALEYRDTFDPGDFIQGCKSFLQQVKKDNLDFETRLREFIEQPK